MARVSYEVQNTLGVTKHDAPSNSVSLDSRNESPPDTSFGYYSLRGFGDNTFPGRDQKGGKNGFSNSETSLSVFAGGLTKPHQPREDSLCNIDANLFSLLDPGEANENSMKIKDNSNSGLSALLSDDWSISLEECNVPIRKDFGRSISPVDNLSLNDFRIPEIMKVDNDMKAEDSIVKKSISSAESDFNLSDMLSSICIDDDPTISKSPNYESLQSSDGNLCLGDFTIDDINQHQFARLSINEDPGIDTAPNCMLSSKFSDTGLDKTASSKNLFSFDILDNDTKNLRNRLNSSEDSNSVSSSFDASSNILESFNDINIQDLIENVSIKTSKNLSLNNDKNSGFSFFCNPSENQLTFSQMLDSKNTDLTARNDSSDDPESDISMLDLYNSLQSSKGSTSESNSSSCDVKEKSKNINITSQGHFSDDYDSGICMSDGRSTSESNSFNSEEMKMESDSNSLSSSDGDDLVAIDLSTCIKSFEDKHSFNPPQPLTAIDATFPSLQSTPEHIFSDTHFLSLPLKNTVNIQAPRMNLRQSLFAKALSCKSKKDPSRVYKVANIKAELFNKVFGYPVPVKEIDCPQIETVACSEKPIAQCNSRRAFGQIELSVPPVR